MEPVQKNGALAGILMALNSGLTTSMPGGGGAFPAALVGGLNKGGALIGALIIAAAEVLLIYPPPPPPPPPPPSSLIAMLMVRPWGRGGGGASTVFRPAPRASGYFRTDYGQDLALLQTRTERVSAVLFLLALAAFPFAASPFLLDLACYSWPRSGRWRSFCSPAMPARSHSAMPACWPPAPSPPVRRSGSPCPPRR